MQVVAPAADQVPGKQVARPPATHAKPAGQVVHWLAPASEYVAAARHCVQVVAPAADQVPGEQLARKPATHAEPAGQVVHWLAPAIEYVAASQANFAVAVHQ